MADQIWKEYFILWMDTRCTCTPRSLSRCSTTWWGQEGCASIRTQHTAETHGDGERGGGNGPESTLQLLCVVIEIAPNALDTVTSAACKGAVLLLQCRKLSSHIFLPTFFWACRISFSTGYTNMEPPSWSMQKNLIFSSDTFSSSFNLQRERGTLQLCALELLTGMETPCCPLPIHPLTPLLPP